MDTAKNLLMGGAKTEIMNNRNLTALGEAIAAKNLEIVQLLINKGADVHRTSKGYTSYDFISPYHFQQSTGSACCTWRLVSGVRLLCRFY